MTPMAANFNIVPAALLELKNQYAVIKAQVADGDPAAHRQHPDPLRRGVPAVTARRRRSPRAWRGSRLATWPRNIRTSSIMCWTATATALPPRELHPIFFGSFDWHSCVHGWWTLLTLTAAVPGDRGSRSDRGAGRRQLHRGEGGGRARLSRTAAQPRVRAALRLGMAALSPPRSDAAARALGGGAGAARARLRRAAAATIWRS